jgi:hypothetical protein
LHKYCPTARKYVAIAPAIDELDTGMQLRIPGSRLINVEQICSFICRDFQMFSGGQAKIDLTLAKDTT